jgi:hypothetical protein
MGGRHQILNWVVAGVYQSQSSLNLSVFVTLQSLLLPHKTFEVCKFFEWLVCEQHILSCIMVTALITLCYSYGIYLFSFPIFCWLWYGYPLFCSGRPNGRFSEVFLHISLVISHVPISSQCLVESHTWTSRQLVMHSYVQSLVHWSYSTHWFDFFFRWLDSPLGA